MFSYLFVLLIIPLPKSFYILEFYFCNFYYISLVLKTLLYCFDYCSSMVYFTIGTAGAISSLFSFSKIFSYFCQFYLSDELLGYFDKFQWKSDEVIGILLISHIILRVVIFMIFNVPSRNMLHSLICKVLLLFLYKIYLK